MPLEFNANGLQVRQLAEILADWQALYIRIFGAGTKVDQETQSNISKMLAEYADRDALIDEIIEAIYLSAYPSSAGGVSFDRVAEITGHKRLGGTSSVLDETMYAAGAPSTAILTGDLTMSVAQAGDLFINTNDFTLGLLGDKTPTGIFVTGGITVQALFASAHSYPLNSWIFVEDADPPEFNGLFQITAVISNSLFYEITGALPAGPSVVGVVREATPFSAQSVEGGEIQALAGTLNVIEVTPTGNLDKVENNTDAVLGQLGETDPELRARRNLTLGKLGGGTPEAIKGIISEVDGVTEVVVFKNDTDFVDLSGVPPHSVEVLVTGGVDQDIFDALTGDASQRGAVSGGIRQHGNVIGSVVDSSGDTQPSAFSRLTQVPIYVDIVVITNDDPTQGPVFPVNGESLILTNLASLVFAGGADVWKATITNAVTSVTGVVSVVPKFGKTASPTTDTTVVIAPTEQADIDSGDITGTIDGVPI